MKTVRFLRLFLLMIIYLIMSISFQSCDPDDDPVYKPNIYIYPTKAINLTLKLNFPKGGGIDVSIPEYGTGWNFAVDTNGLINNTYAYLFYESTQPNVWQKQYGWIIKVDELESFFKQNMVDYGFKDREINDFIEYWIPRLKKFQYYSICPQTKSKIDAVIQLDFSNQPDNILRLFYVIKGLNQQQDNLIIPTIDNFERKGYFVTEWGVILK